jgi:TonB family protein
VAIRIVEPPPAPPDEPVIPIPVPVPQPRPEVCPEPEPPRQQSSQPLGNSPTTSAGEGRGQDTGPGTDTGTGRGDGGTGDSGLNRVVPPSPRGLILPPSDRPGRVRGRTVTVYVWVTERGTVQADSTRLAPGSGDSGFDARLRRQAAEWVFHPARRDGQALAAWFEYTITL